MRTIQYKKQSNKIEYFGSWTGLQQGTEKQLESISDYAYGAGKLGVAGQSITLTKSIGASAKALAAGVDFQYNKRLDASITEDAVDGFGSIAGGIIDTGTSGALASGKSIRLVDASTGSALNIKNGSGLNLKVYAKNLSVITSPPADRMYVDPINGRFVLPRPIFFHKCQGLSMSVDSTINVPDKLGYSLITAQSGVNIGSISASGGKFGNCIKAYVADNSSAGYCVRYYTAKNELQGKLTASSWFSLFTNVLAESYNDFSWFADNSSSIIVTLSKSNTTARVTLSINNVLVMTHTLSTGDYISGTHHHLYIVADRSGGLSGGKTVRVFLDATEILYSSLVFNLPDAEGSFYALYPHSTGACTSYITLSNIKIWKEALQDPSFEYNSGNGREDALHPIYGSTNGYKPKLISPGGVGYLYIPPAESPASLPKPSAGDNTPVQLEAVSDYANGVGYFGTGHKIYDTDYSVLAEGTDYVYDEAWDGSGAHAIDKYDDGVSGALASGRIIRVVNDIGGVAKNITDATGLNLKPVVKNMPTDKFSPPTTEIYIDPVRGKIILPRPILFEPFNNGYNTELINKITWGLTLTGAGSLIPCACKFAHGIRAVVYPSAGEVYFRGIIPVVNYNKGTLSAWVSHYFAQGVSHAQRWWLYFDNNNYFGISSWTNASTNGYAEAILGGVGISPLIPSFSWAIEEVKHLYIVWDNAGLSDGSKVKIYINGSLMLNTSNAFDFTGKTPMFFLDSVSTGDTCNSQSWISQLKIWQDAIEDVAWDYNSGNGREDALHPIYGSTNGYKPNLTGVGGVGYYKASGAGSLVRGTV